MPLHLRRDTSLMQRWLTVLAAGLLGGCGSEETVIHYTSPFIAVAADFAPDDYEDFRMATERFADRRGFGLTLNEYGRGQFCFLLYDKTPPDLNLLACAKRTDFVVVDAIARGEPTSAQRAIFSAYMESVRPFVTNVRPYDDYPLATSD